jgi:hypothetical protein
MNPLVCLSAILVLLAGTQGLAQSPEEIELARTIAETEKKVVVAKNMGLTDAESEAFRPVYNNYQTDVRKLNDRTFKFLEIQSGRVKLKKSYVKKFGKVLPAKKLMRYYQVENKIEAMINFDLVQQIPLAQ